MRRFQSWGRYPPASQQTVEMPWRNDPLPLDGLAGQTVLPFGNGRSYGDSCLNDGGTLINARPLNRFIGFDQEQGILKCEAGVLLVEILALIVPRNWFLPVTPGTQYITVGGAIANDVHGKNHHKAGTFGCHLRRFELLRSDGTRQVCSADENSELFRCTIGGLGLTGLITWAEFSLKPVPGPAILQETIRYGNLDEFFDLAEESDEKFEYTVAWIDCLASGSKLGRGIFLRGKHSDIHHAGHRKVPGVKITVPFDPPVSLVNRWTLGIFNTLHYTRQRKEPRSAIVHYEPFFYPLDAIGNWNRIYGPKGFLQYQCVVPFIDGKTAIREILELITRSGSGSFLAVLKLFGNITSPGLLSFPKPGATLALDFPNCGDKTFKLLEQLDEVVRSANGAVYPAKDARMSGRSFRHYFPQWETFRPFIDPRFSSSFIRRVTSTKT